MLRPTARCRSSPTTTEPWPRISAAGLAASVLASALPSFGVRTSRSVPFSTLRISKFGMPRPTNAAMWKMGLSGTVVTPKGMTEGEWLCTTALTSGRTL